MPARGVVEEASCFPLWVAGWCGHGATAGLPFLQCLIKKSPFPLMQEMRRALLGEPRFAEIGAAAGWRSAVPARALTASKPRHRVDFGTRAYAIWKNRLSSAC